jgi:RND superfamily putative drug exporter
VSRLARTCYRRRRWVAAIWVALLVALNLVASSVGTVNRVDYTMPGTDSARAQALLAEHVPDAAGGTVDLIVHDPRGVGRPATQDRLDDLEREVARLDHVQSLRTAGVSDDGTVALVVVQLDDTIEKVPTRSVEAITEVAADARADGLQVEAGGFAAQNAEAAEAGSEGLGMIAALVILVIAFGAAVAAGLPLLIAITGLGVSLSTITLLSHVLMVPEWGAGLATMIGLGVGIDYALFIVNRYRAGLRDGDDPEQAVVTAMTTSGRAVLFAGCTVMIALFGLGAMGLEYLWATAVTTSVTVLVMLLATLTLLPALLGFMGRNIDRGRIPFVKGDAGAEGGLWTRWSHVVQRRPLLTGTVALVILLGLAAPAVGLRFGYPDAGTGPESLSSRRAYDLVAEGFGPGANGPLVVAVDGARDAAVVDRVSAALAADPGVAAVLPPETDGRGAAALIVIPTSGPQDEATVDLIHHLRRDVVPEAVGRSGADVTIGGSVASFVDESTFMSARLPLFIGAVVLLSFLLLLVVFRSLLVALKAALMNLLAIGAAYGVMALALRGGWFGHLLGIEEPTPIPVWVPVMTFAMLFGLSMDYEVFLLSRIREEWQRTRDNATAVAHGLASTGRVITAAAAIMVTVFGAYIFEDQVLMKVIGLGLSVAVLVDATLVRMVLVPSTMELLGDRNWWLPAWLDRLLPTIDLEGTADAAPEEAAADPVVLDGTGTPEVGSPADREPEPVLAGR